VVTLRCSAGPAGCGTRERLLLLQVPWARIIDDPAEADALAQSSPETPCRPALVGRRTGAPTTKP